MYGYGGVALAAEGSAAMPDLARADTAAPVGNGATGTNLQEHDVDEPDTAKTANGVLVTTIGGRLVVFDVTGEAPVELGSVQIEPLAQRLETFSPPDVPPGAEVAPSPSWGQAQLLMDGNRVVIIGSGFRSHDVATQRDMSLVAPMPTTTVTLVDIADPGAPTVLSTTEIEGSLLDARQHEGSVRIVTTSSPTPVFPAPADDFVDDQGNPDPAEEAKAVEANKAALQAMSGEDFLPRVVVRDAEGTITQSRPAMSCSALAHPDEFAGAGVATITTLRPAQAAPDVDPALDRIGVASDGQTVYSSADRLYVATTPGGFAWPGALPIAVLPGGGPTSITTELHAFDVTTPDATSYRASGSVQGSIIGSWALSERDGYLRVATTRDHGGQPGAAPASSEVAVAAEPAAAAGPPPPSVVPPAEPMAPPVTDPDQPIEQPPAEPVAPPVTDPDQPIEQPPAEPMAPPVTDPDQPIEQPPAEPVAPPLTDPDQPIEQPPVPNTDSAITILRESGDQLSVVGSVEGLGRGESIQAVRWFDTTAYVVTFRQTDPLYVVDLTDPSAPAVTGELKVPGFSAYLHPVGDDVLLGVGSSATDSGQLTGVQVSTFNVADPVVPRQVSVLNRPDSSTDVGWDSTVFSYLPQEHLAVFPVVGPQGLSVLGVRVDDQGALTEAGAFDVTSAAYDWGPTKAMPVSAGTVVVITQDGYDTVLTLLDSSMSPTGALTLR
jgi:hypothetical protein